MSREGKLSTALLLSAIALGVAGDAFFNGRELGVNVFLFAGCFVASLALLLRIGRAPLHHGRRFMAAPLLIFAAAFAWHDSPLLAAVNLLAVAGAVSLGALRRTQPKPQNAGLGEYAAGLVSAGAGTFVGPMFLLQTEVPWDQAARGLHGTRAAAFGRGAAIGVPLLVVFGGLFIAADSVFKGLVTAALPGFGNPWTHAVLFALVAWCSAGLLRDLLASREDARVLSTDVLLRRRVSLRLGTSEIAIALAALDLLFLAFVIVQARYLFGGASLVEARAHLTYASYARHGFFELVIVSILVLPVLLAANVMAIGRARVVRVLSAMLIVLELAVAASALQRLRVYEQQYGLTELRIYAIGVVAWLGCIFLWSCGTVLRGRMRRFAVGAVVAGFVMTAALNVIDPDALIARTNLARPQADVTYLARLSDDAVPTLVAKLPSVANTELRRELARRLLARSTAPVGLLSWNLSRAHARTVLVAQRATLLRLAR
jgi:hypothetical protein